MIVYLVHHGDAVGPDVDAARPLSAVGQRHVEELASEAASRGVRPEIVWHSGKLRARQTAEAFWRACNALATFSATRDLQPSDPPAWIRDRLRGGTQDVLIAGHFPHLPGLLALLLHRHHGEGVEFPPHGIVALESSDHGETWTELWRSSGTGAGEPTHRR
ncbi:MAG: phosphohistidine phosphatase SixA [Acidimicrobiia bacterium]|nr:phosphohistidine phosphatase SixA [Acidimicrobiia bacterium]